MILGNTEEKLLGIVLGMVDSTLVTVGEADGTVDGLLLGAGDRKRDFYYLVCAGGRKIKK